MFFVSLSLLLPCDALPFVLIHETIDTCIREAQGHWFLNKICTRTEMPMNGNKITELHFVNTRENNASLRIR